MRRAMHTTVPPKKAEPLPDYVVLWAGWHLRRMDHLNSAVYRSPGPPTRMAKGNDEGGSVEKRAGKIADTIVQNE